MAQFPGIATKATPAATDGILLDDQADSGNAKRAAVNSFKLSVFAATTSAELATVISDETGSGALVFATSPTLVTPALGTPASGNLANCTGYPAAGNDTEVQFNSSGSFTGDSNFWWDNTNKFLSLGSAAQTATAGVADANTLLRVTADADGIYGVRMQNKSTGTAADFRFAIADENSGYVAFAHPGTGNTGTLFGITRKNGSFVFNNRAGGDPNRTLGIGTIANDSLVFGTQNTERMKIDGSGSIYFGSHTAIGAETVSGFITIKDLAGTSRKLAVVS